mgnify:CR=1 FL=1
MEFTLALEFTFSSQQIIKFFLNHTKNAHTHGTHHEHKRFILSQYVILTL